MMLRVETGSPVWKVYLDISSACSAHSVWGKRTIAVESCRFVASSSLR